MRFTLPTIFLAALLVPTAAAEAATYCVNAPGCKGSSKASLDLALAATDAAADVDDIVLGAGTYTGHFANAPGRPVRVTGAGAVTKFVTDNDTAALTLSGAASSASNLRFEVANGYAAGLRLDTGAHGSAIQVGATKSHTTGIELGEDATLRDARIDLGAFEWAVAVRTDGEDTTIEDVDVKAEFGLVLSGDATVRRARIKTGARAVEFRAGTTRLESSLVDVRGGGEAISSFTQDTARADLAHVTIVGAKAIQRAAFDLEAQPVESQVTVTVRDSIVTGMDQLYALSSQFGRAELTMDHVVRDPGVKTSRTAQTGVNTVTDVDAVPAAPLAADFSLPAGSPLIDAGSDTPADGSTDLLGRPRLVGARRDPGAFETPAAPVAATPETPVTPVTGAPAGAPAVAPVVVTAAAPVPDRVAPVISGLKASRSKLAFKLSEPANVTVKITGARKLTKRFKLTRAVAVKLKLKPGRYRVTIEAADAAGNRAKPLKRSF